VQAKTAGREPDPADGLRGKQRSVHNTYFTLPVLFAMISNHYAMTYGATDNWLVLAVMAAAGAAIRAWFVARHKLHLTGRVSPLPVAVGVLLLCGVAFALAPRQRVAAAFANRVANGVANRDPGFVRVQHIVAERCAVCHAAAPTQVGFVVAPKGVLLDKPERIVAQAAQMRQQIATRTMPIANLTQMTEDERTAVIAWIDLGAHTTP
jgi:uncharacterized membrane protein